MILSITYKNGMIKILSAIKEPSNPFLPHFTNGIITTQANNMELIGYNDQVNFPDIAMSQIKHTTMPTSNNNEKAIAKIFRKEVALLFAAFSA